MSKAQIQITKSLLLLLILVFYACIFVFIGYAFGNTSTIDTYAKNQSTNTKYGCGYQENYLCGHLTVGEIDAIFGLGYSCKNYQCDSPATLRQEAIQSTKITGFLGRGIIGITNIPIWMNIILFTPLMATLIFLIVTSLPTFNGGG